MTIMPIYYVNYWELKREQDTEREPLSYWDLSQSPIKLEPTQITKKRRSISLGFTWFLLQPKAGLWSVSLCQCTESNGWSQYSSSKKYRGSFIRLSHRYVQLGCQSLSWLPKVPLMLESKIGIFGWQLIGHILDLCCRQRWISLDSIATKAVDKMSRSALYMKPTVTRQIPSILSQTTASFWYWQANQKWQGTK